MAKQHLLKRIFSPLPKADVMMLARKIKKENPKLSDEAAIMSARRKLLNKRIFKK